MRRQFQGHLQKNFSEIGPLFDDQFFDVAQPTSDRFARRSVVTPFSGNSGQLPSIAESSLAEDAAAAVRE